ncbi:hypothetical protein ACI7BZ_06560 [Xanthobacter sp. AM11]|uniref:hypothetical protein n=1 Tax=Xanthobacter sp. AM11 TaxID=3380643 RepID=UPI0039BF3C90
MALLLGPGLLLAGCGEDEAPARRPVATSTTVPRDAAPATTPAAAPVAARDWLELSDKTPPEAWLAARAGVPASPALDARLARLLREADTVFDETPRMLANRTAQLQNMLAGIAIAEPPQDILEGFIPLGRAGGRAGYSDLCHHYFNLRASGLDRAAALKALATAAPRAPRETP